jgi:predicted nucleotidyltransferase
MLLKNTRFLNKIKRFYKRHETEIIDIILFGSAVRGKEKPADIDILIIFKSKVNFDLSYELKKELSAFGKVEIISKTYFQLFEPSFVAREAILSEGYSLIQRKFIHQGLGYSSFMLFKYNLKGLSKTKQTQFYYSLYGRNRQKGMLEELDSKKFGENMILTPIENEEKMKDYLRRWVEFTQFQILLPSRIVTKIKNTIK